MRQPAKILGYIKCAVEYPKMALVVELWLNRNFSQRLRDYIPVKETDAKDKHVDAMHAFSTV